MCWSFSSDLLPGHCRRMPRRLASFRAIISASATRPRRAMHRFPTMRRSCRICRKTAPNRQDPAASCIVKPSLVLTAVTQRISVFTSRSHLSAKDFFTSSLVLPFRRSRTKVVWHRSLQVRLNLEAAARTRVRLRRPKPRRKDLRKDLRKLAAAVIRRHRQVLSP